MSNRLKTGERWLADMQKTWASETVQYARANAGSYMSATIGRSEFNVEDISGAMLRVETKDFIIFASDLVLNSTAVEPAHGDRITEGGFVYEVSPPGPGINHWSWDGSHRNRYRIHTKLIGPEES